MQWNWMVSTSIVARNERSCRYSFQEWKCVKRVEPRVMTEVSGNDNWWLVKFSTNKNTDGKEIKRMLTNNQVNK